MSGAGHGIYVTGAAGSGVTTLGRAMAAVLDVVHADCDDLYRLPTEPTTRWLTRNKPSAHCPARVSILGLAAKGERPWTRLKAGGT